MGGLYFIPGASSEGLCSPTKFYIHTVTDRLLKSLQAHPNSIAVIPSKGIVAKRLAQCLNPSLPSGVHQKALEVYSYIFSLIGTDALSRDLPLYLPGLSSTLSFASLTVRAPFLAVFETHILKLKADALRPALKALILALLPGLEEETSEDFERTLKLVDGFKNAVRSGGATSGNDQASGDEYFWQCFFLASITSNSRRLGALAYLVRNLPRLGQPLRRHSVVSVQDDGNGETGEPIERLADIVTQPEPGLLLRCFAAGLADDQILIQRGFLDLLVTRLPIHSTVLQKRVKPEDLEKLLSAAAGVVARRDMSLNRRLWTWLLGPEPTSELDVDGAPQSPTSAVDDVSGAMGISRTSYFEEFGLQPLIKALLKMIAQHQTNPMERARPFRICLSLMDRWEIGGLVVPEIFMPVVNSVRKYADECSDKTHFNEVLRSASVFFDGVESGLIWSEIVSLIAAAMGSSGLDAPERLDKLSLVDFIINHFNVREEEMLMVHAPTAALTILAMLNNTARGGSSLKSDLTTTSEKVLVLALNIAQSLVDLTPERAYVQDLSGQDTSKHNLLNLQETDILSRSKTFYVQDQGNLDSFGPPFPPSALGELLLRQSIKLASIGLDTQISSAEGGGRTKLLSTLMSKVPKSQMLDVSELLTSIHTKLSSVSQLPFSALTSTIALINSLYPNSYLTAEEVSGLIDPVVRLAWSYLSASHPKYHVETVRYLWQLQTTLTMQNHEIEAAICSIMIEHDVGGTFTVREADPGRSFSILWTHTLQDNAGHLDRRGSKNTNTDLINPVRASGVGNYEVMLARPLFLLLDALMDERTQLFTTVRTWLQTVIGIDRYIFKSDLKDKY
jgi:hypothetical protein